MENNDKIVLSDKTVGKEYQIPELVDLKSITEVMGSNYCYSGTSAGANCVNGGLF